MPETNAKKGRRYLMEARREAGYASRPLAAAAVPFCESSLGRHERGEVEVTPRDMALYARHYGRRDILLKYCSECPVGRMNGFGVTDRGFAHATMRLARRLRNDAGRLSEALEQIADTGGEKGKAHPQFVETVMELKELFGAIADYFLCAAAPGGGKESAATDNGNVGAAMRDA